MRMRDQDRSTIEMTPAIMEEQERHDRLAALAAYYHQSLRQWGLPDLLVHELVATWHDHYLASE